MSTFDLETEFEWGDGGAGHGETLEVFDEVDEMDLASGLLEAENEPELDHFLRSLIRKAMRKLGRPLPPNVAHGILGLLKQAALKAIPATGGAPGTASAFDRKGGQATEDAERIFGLELEGLSSEDQEFEIARRFVRFAGSAVRAGARGGARRGFQRAAQRFAPGLLRPAARPRRPKIQVRGGHWIQRGRDVLIINCVPPPGAGGAPGQQPSEPPSSGPASAPEDTPGAATPEPAAADQGSDNAPLEEF